MPKKPSKQKLDNAKKKAQTVGDAAAINAAVDGASVELGERIVALEDVVSGIPEPGTGTTTLGLIALARSGG